MMESFFSTLQRELLDRRSWTTRKELASAIFEWIEAWYNPRRRLADRLSQPCRARTPVHRRGACGMMRQQNNCPENRGKLNQANTDNLIDNGPGITTVDNTVPASDEWGDACDTDDDNDGIDDAAEDPLTACGAYTGLSAGRGNAAGGDTTDDDNGNGVPAPADGADNGPSWDTDNDHVRDGVECWLGSNPRSAGSHAVCGNSADADQDGLAWRAECKWGTSDNLKDSDGDGLMDCVEANDNDGNGMSNFTGDVINSAKASNGIYGKTLDFDLDGSGVVNFTGDTVMSAKIANHVGGVCL